MNNQLRMGIKVESEHTKTIQFIKDFYKKYNRFPTNRQIFEHISKDHLREHKNYYTVLNKVKL